MGAYVATRLLLSLVVLWIVMTFVFVVLRVLPGDYAEQQVATRYFAGSAGESPGDAVREARRELGLDRSLPVQYRDYLFSLLQGDFGESFRNQQSPLAYVRHALPYSIQLGLMTAFVAFAVGLPVGVLSALHQDSLLDGVLRIVAVLGIAAPSFWLATIGTFLALRTGWLELNIINPPLVWDDPSKSFQLFVIPAVSGGLAGGAALMRITRSQVLDVLRQDYVRTAWAKGLAQRAVVLRHVVRNALLPVVTVFGFLLTGVVSGGVILESMFNIPGMGRTLVEAMNQRDVPVVQGTVFVIASGILVINLLVDLSYTWIDPRVRLLATG